jgi:hydrophobic/amphiphilic exporter-1 (mainly G- bacteria), HAE1 family
MSLPRFAVRRPVTTGMMVLAALVIGLISINLINLDMFPSFQRPVLRVVVPYPNASPAEIERRIVRPLEEAMGTVRHLEAIRSTASQDQGSVELEFRPGTDMDLASLEVREKVDQVRGDLPEDVRRVDVRRFSSDAMPVLRGGISWEGDAAELTDLVERRIQPTLLQVPGVASVEFSGLERREITVELDQARMEAAGVSAGQVNRALTAGNLDLSAGEIELAGTRYLIRAQGQLDRVEELAALPIRADGLRLGDVALVRYDYPERDFFYRLDNRNARQFEVFKDSDANVVAVAGEVKETLERMKRQPGLEGIEFRFWQDSSRGILEALGALARAGLFGGGMAIVVLFLFLRRVTPTLIVATAIPVSIIFTVFILYVAGETLNIITLSGLMMAVGMLIDNAVVVVENIFRHREKGDTPEGAAMEGASEVGLAIVAGTLTTVIVFAPLVFMRPDQMGTQIRAFGMSISFAMVASLLVALTLVPLLSVRLLRGRLPDPGRGWRWFSDRYRRLLDSILDHRPATAALVLLLFAGGGAILYQLPKELMPEEDNRFIQLSITTPRGMTIQERSALFDGVERSLLERAEELDIESVSAISTRRFNSMSISLRSFGDGGTLATAEVGERIDRLLPVVPGVEWTQRRSWGPGGRLSVRLNGESTEVLRQIAEQVEQRLQTEVPQVTNLSNSLQAGAEEVRVRIDREAAERQGITSAQVAQAVANALRGRVATRFRTADREIDVMVQLREEDRLSIGQLGNLAIEVPGGRSTTLATVARLEVTAGPQDIRREDRRTSISVNAELRPGAPREDAQRGIQAAMAGMQLPTGYTWDMGRDFREQQQQFGEMGFAAVLSLLLIYLVLAALFESLLLPVIIYFSIFFALPGLGLIFLLTGTSISILSFLGMLITVGIVVNNSIVMIDLVNQLRARGMARRQALLDGCQARLRPVLMTSLTTLLGLVPMAFLAGEGMGQIFAPMGRAVIGGLATSLVLTLTLTPVLYAWIDDIGQWLEDVWAGMRAAARPRAPSTADPAPEAATGD